MTHFQGHLRDTFIRAFEQFAETDGDPEAPVIHEIRYEPTTITLRKAAGMMMHCTDIIPSSDYEQLREAIGWEFRNTYAGAGFAMLRYFRERSR